MSNIENVAFVKNEFPMNGKFLSLFGHSLRMGWKRIYHQYFPQIWFYFLRIKINMDNPCHKKRLSSISWQGFNHFPPCKIQYRYDGVCDQTTSQTLLVLIWSIWSIRLDTWTFPGRFPQPSGFATEASYSSTSLKESNPKLKLFCNR